MRVDQYQTGVQGNLSQIRQILPKQSPGFCVAVLQQPPPEIRVRVKIQHEVLHPSEETHIVGILRDGSGDVGGVPRTGEPEVGPGHDRTGTYPNEGNLKLMSEPQEAISIEHLDQHQIELLLRHRQRFHLLLPQQPTRLATHEIQHEHNLIRLRHRLRDAINRDEIHINLILFTKTNILVIPQRFLLRKMTDNRHLMPSLREFLQKRLEGIEMALPSVRKQSEYLQTLT